MAGMQKKDFDQPDETRRFDHGRIDLVTLPRATIGRAVFEPGWRWSNDVKPIAGTDSCQARHVGVAQSGKLHVSHEDGSEQDIGPGDTYVIEPGHDAWVIGDDAFIGYEFESRSAEEYARG